MDFTCWLAILCLLQNLSSLRKYAITQFLLICMLSQCHFSLLIHLAKTFSYSQNANVLIQLKKDMPFSNFFHRNLSCKSRACIFKQLIDSKKLLGGFLCKEMDLLQYLRSFSMQFPPILQRSKGSLRLCLVGV